MTNFLLEFYEAISTFDIIYLIFLILSLLKCSRKGFVLSLLAASKWLLAYVITLILFPKARPFVDGIIDSNYVLDIVLGVGMFILVIFVILMINKPIIIKLVNLTIMKSYITVYLLIIKNKDNNKKEIIKI